MLLSSLEGTRVCMCVFSPVFDSLRNTVPLSLGHLPAASLLARSAVARYFSVALPLHINRGVLEGSIPAQHLSAAATRRPRQRPADLDGTRGEEAGDAYVQSMYACT